jgi:REP element-mobilizing transposase RayT
MTVPRNQQISLDHTPYYHCTTRCVRRAFLCGDDRHSGNNFDHRKRWLERRLIKLSKVFAIDLLAYAILSNHYHVVVRINVRQANCWSDEQVIERWRRVFSVPDYISPELVAMWRERLNSLSWYMRCLNEPLARVSNREDSCKGRFWEGRYRCQALLDETALLKCMAYVDLNPIRANIAKTPETSCHTSIKARIEGNDGFLLPFSDAANSRPDTLPMKQMEYFSLVDWTGRHLHRKKRGRIPAQLPQILIRLNADGEHWLAEMTNYGHWYFRAVGSINAMQRYCQHLGQKWLQGASKLTQSPI